MGSRRAGEDIRGPRAVRARRMRQTENGAEAPLPARPLLTTGEAARSLGVSVQTIRNWVARGQLRAVKRGGRAFVPRAVVAAELRRTSELVPERAALTPAEIRALPAAERMSAWIERARVHG